MLSHVTAAVLHGLALWNTPLDVVHLTRNHRYAADSSSAATAEPYFAYSASRLRG